MYTCGGGLTGGVSCLDHKLLYDAMEDVSVVVTIVRMDTEILNWLGTAEER